MDERSHGGRPSVQVLDVPERSGLQQAVNLVLQNVAQAPVGRKVAVGNLNEQGDAPPCGTERPFLVVGLQAVPFEGEAPVRIGVHREEETDLLVLNRSPVPRAIRGLVLSLPGWALTASVSRERPIGPHGVLSPSVVTAILPLAST